MVPCAVSDSMQPLTASHIRSNSYLPQLLPVYQIWSWCWPQCKTQGTKTAVHYLQCVLSDELSLIHLEALLFPNISKACRSDTWLSYTVNLLWSVHLQHRQSTYHARCNQGPPGTCLQPQLGTRSHGSQSRTNYRNLFHRQNNMRYVTCFIVSTYFSIHWLMCPRVLGIIRQLCQHGECVTIGALFRATVTHLVHSTVLHPPGGRCCFWLAADSRRTESSRHATSVWGRLSPPRVKCKTCGYLEASCSSLGALVFECVSYSVCWKVNRVTFVIWIIICNAAVHVVHQQRTISIIPVRSGWKTYKQKCTAFLIVRLFISCGATWPGLK